ncbi:MAG: glycosyltransferase family 2 protein [Methanothrix sp.]
MKPRVGIIILNWNGWEDTIECLESLYQITYPNYEVIVVDNGSKDNSIEMIRKYCEGGMIVESNFISFNRENKPISIDEYTKDEMEIKSDITDIISEDLPPNRRLIIIKNKKNYGFAQGNNIGIEFALNNGTEYIFILNNDTIVAHDFLDILVDAIENDMEVGIAGSTCYYYDKPDMIWAKGTKINWWTGEIKEIETCRVEEVDSVSGCAMIIKNTVFNIISLFDTRFPFGYEDHEFCTRARRENFKVVCVPDSKIWHKVARSRNELMSNMTERKALLGETGHFRLKDRLFFLKICSPTKAQYISQCIFYFAIMVPISALSYCRTSGIEASAAKAKSILQEILGLIK